MLPNKEVNSSNKISRRDLLELGGVALGGFVLNACRPVQLETTQTQPTYSTETSTPTKTPTPTETSTIEPILTKRVLPSKTPTPTETSTIEPILTKRVLPCTLRSEGEPETILMFDYMHDYPLDPEENKRCVDFKKTVLSLIESTGALTREQISQSKLLLCDWGPEIASAVVKYKGEGYFVRKMANENPQIFPKVRVFDTTGLHFTYNPNPYDMGLLNSGKFSDKDGNVVYNVTRNIGYNDLNQPCITVFLDRDNPTTTINLQGVDMYDSGGVFVEVKMPGGPTGGVEIKGKTFPVFLMCEPGYIWSVHEKIDSSFYKSEPLARWDMLGGKWIIAPDINKLDLIIP